MLSISQKLSPRLPISSKTVSSKERYPCLRAHWKSNWTSIARGKTSIEQERRSSTVRWFCSCAVYPKKKSKLLQKKTKSFSTRWKFSRKRRSYCSWLLIIQKKGIQSLWLLESIQSAKAVPVGRMNSIKNRVSFHSILRSTKYQPTKEFCLLILTKTPIKALPWELNLPCYFPSNRNQFYLL